MNRPIKFRGQSKLMGDHWHYGYLRVTTDGRAFISEPGQYSDFDEVEVDPETVGQFINRADRSGTEIYEGDVANITSATYNGEDFEGVVAFDDSTFCLARLRQSERAKELGYIDKVRFWDDGCHDHYSLEMIETFQIEVIGSIHTHPELVEPNQKDTTP